VEGGKPFNSSEISSPGGPLPLSSSLQPGSAANASMPAAATQRLLFKREFMRFTIPIG